MQRLPISIRQFLTQHLRTVASAASHYSVKLIPNLLPSSSSGHQFGSSSGRPQWHEWSQCLARHLRHTLRPGYQWHPLIEVAKAVHLAVEQVMHAADDNPKFELRPNAADDHLDTRAIHQEYAEDSDSSYS